MIKLSEREQEVLMLYCQKGRIKPVAEALGRSVSTVRHQRSSVMRKLGARNAVELTLLAVQKGLVKP